MSLLIEQGTPEWLEWRKHGIGASEAAAVMGESPYQTPLELWREKVSPELKPSGSDYALQRGHAVEAQIRAGHEFESGLDFPPALFEHPIYSWMRCSLDGWNEAGRHGIEIKMVGAKAFEDNAIPVHHNIQMQYQMLTTGTTEWGYIKSVDGSLWSRQTVEADGELQGRIVVACAGFWDMVLRHIAPPYTDEDWMEVADAELDNCLARLKEVTGKKAKDDLRVIVFKVARKHHVRVITSTGDKVCVSPPRITFVKQ